MSTTKARPAAADRFEWSGFEFPWGATQCAPYADDKDRVIVRWADVPASWQADDGETVTAPKVAPTTDKDRLFAVYSWMNDRVMFLLSDAGDGTVMTWSTCGECLSYWSACRCVRGITESRSIRWSRKRSGEGWQVGNSKVSEIMRAAEGVTADDEPASVPTPRRSARSASAPQTGRTRPSQGRTGHATATAEPVDAPTLAEIDAGAGDAAADAVEEAMSTGSRRGRRARR